MRVLVLASIASVFAVAAFGQQTTEKASAIHASVCEIAYNPGRFEGKAVALRARYTVNWEWGAGIGQEGCDRGLTVVFADGYSGAGDLSNLYVKKDAEFNIFEKQERQLCNGMSMLCEFDFLEADFTGVIVGPKHFGHGVPPEASVIVVTSVAAPKLHRDEHPMGTQSPPLPTSIPEPQQR
jgi:hypothetical protein